MLFNYLVGTLGWLIIHFEVHHLWNPDWTLAQVNTDFDDSPAVADYGRFDTAYLDPNSNYPLLDDHDDPLMDEFAIKDGGRIPLLSMTYINKTVPKPCDKEVIVMQC